MAVGVPESEVFAAADAVLARGERPTVERVRLELGRGSPARVGKLLDQWWGRLAERLNGESRLPALPGEVSQAFVAAWQQAVLLAQGIAELGLSEQRQILTAEMKRITEAEDQARQESAAYRQQADEAAAARQAIEVRLADLELLLKQRGLQIEDLQLQREGLIGERNDALEHGKGLQEKLQALQVKSEQDRVAQDAYIRKVEERAHREVDRAREERKASATQAKLVSTQLEKLQRKLDSAQADLHRSEQRIAAQEARADTLAQQLIRLSETSPLKRKPRIKRQAQPRAIKAGPQPQ
ncbi:TPA: DNA-binding protein [Pseudomonas aeruginosa]|uniref:DNA-binding protein n=1 Tax=Pseudomonas tohonis TaxID=2725477 RepID=UPI0015661490|nr:DNA-binding protein [Pseudomonas tohonis]